MDAAGIFHKIPRIDDSRLAEIFAREVLAMLVRKELLSPEWAERILSWRHTGFKRPSGEGQEGEPEFLGAPDGIYLWRLLLFHRCCIKMYSNINP